MKKYFASLLTSPLILMPCLFASTIPSDNTTARMGDGVTVTTLPNGLEIIVKEDRSAPVASVQAWVRTGSIHEGEWLGAGLSHILEHMLFKGTDKRQASDIARQIQELGGYVNAYTSFDRTVYYVDVPSDGVPTVIDILADAMLNSTLPPDEYVKEQEVIRREFAMGFDSPERTSQKLLFETAFSNHPYRYPVIGYLDVYNKLTREDVFAYYKCRYVPNNMFFVVVGDVNPDTVIKKISENFAEVPRAPLPNVFIADEPRQLGLRVRHETFPTDLTRLVMAWKIPGVTHPDMPALDLLATILGDGRSSRLYRNVRTRDGLAHSIDAFSYTPSGTGLFGIQAITDPDQREHTIAAIQAEIEQLRTKGVTDAELEKAKKRILASHYAGMKTMSGQASDLGSNWLLASNIDFSEQYLDAMRAVTADDLQRIARQYLVQDQLTLTSLNPPKSNTNIAASHTTSSPKADDIQKFDLPGGLRLLVRRDTRLPLVSSVAVFRGGVLDEIPSQNGLTTLMANTIIKGTTTRSADDISESIESVGGDISTNSGLNSFAVAVNTMSDDWQLGLDILADVVIRPAFPDDAVAREKTIQIASIKSENEQPTRVASNLLRSSLYGDHPYSKPRIGTVETVANMTAEDLRAFHKCLAVAANCVIAVFGDVDPEAVRNQVTKLFASLPTGQPNLAPIPPVPALDADLQATQVLDKAQAVLMVGFHGPTMSDPDRLPLELISEASSDLGSRFFVKIRDEMGLAYFVGSSMTPGLARGLFGFYLGTDPAKIDPVRTAFLNEISSLASNGLTEEEFRRAKAKLIGQQKIRLQSNDDFAYMTALDELYGLGYDDYLNQIDRLETLTLEQVNEVARRTFADQRHVVALVSPDTSKKSAAKSPAPSESEPAATTP